MGHQSFQLDGVKGGGEGFVGDVFTGTWTLRCPLPPIPKVQNPTEGCSDVSLELGPETVGCIP